MKRSKKRTQERAAKKALKQRAMLKPGDESNYARKAAYLRGNGGWGFEYADPKPWK